LILALNDSAEAFVERCQIVDNARSADTPGLCLKSLQTLCQLTGSLYPLVQSIRRFLFVGEPVNTALHACCPTSTVCRTSSSVHQA